MDRIEKAMEYRARGYNCAQAVSCVFSEDVGKSVKELYTLSEAFGLGMGTSHQTCGALSGAILILSLLKSSGDEKNNTKSDTYKECEKLEKEFLNLTGDALCCEIKSKAKTSCNDCVKNAVIALERTLSLRE